MNQMQQHADFIRGLDGWATPPAAAVEALKTWDAAQSSITTSPMPALRSDAYSGTLTPKNVAERLNDAGVAIAGAYAAEKIIGELDGPLAQRVADGVLADADRIVGELAVMFDKYADRLAQAAPLVPAGVTADELMSTASPAVVEAWQMLGIAEANLEQVAHIRQQLASRFGYPAPTPEVSAWIAPVDNDELHRASLVWRGHQPIGAVDAGMTSPLPEVRGGRWRWLIEAGFELRCNTADQAAEVAAVLTPAAA